jgi:hypothetical protein
MVIVASSYLRFSIEVGVEVGTFFANSDSTAVDSSLPGCDMGSALYFKVYSSSVSSNLLGMLGAEDEGTVIPQNVWNYLPSDTASHPRRIESSDYNR